MLDYFKDVISASGARVRSPMLGSILLVFVLLNWKEFFYIFFAETSAQVRLSYFDANTSYSSLILFPLIGGIALSILYPWLNLVSEHLAKKPIRSLKRLQGEENHLREIYLLENAAKLQEAQAKFEAVHEQRKIDAARRLEEAGRMKDSSLVNELVGDRTERDGRKPEDLEISDEALEVLGIIAASKTGKFEIENIDSTHPSVWLNDSSSQVSSRFEVLKLQETHDELVRNKLITPSPNGLITKLGYAVLKVKS